MGTFMVLVSLVAAATARNHKDPHFEDGRSVIVHLFEWKWNDIAEECERFLGPKGFGGIQISPPNENIVLWDNHRPWWERYQPISYVLVTRSGNEQEFADMVYRCNAVGVRIYADALLNDMAAEHSEIIGTAGNTAVISKWEYPAVAYTREDFHTPLCSIKDTDYTKNATAVRDCELVGLKDLNQTNEHVRDMIVAYMNRLIDLGVAGFRIDAAKHMWPEDLSVIYGRLNTLNTLHGFPCDALPYIYQEVIDYGGEAISRDEYTPLAAVTEFKVGMELSRAFRGNNDLKWLVNWGPEWALLADSDALTFIENHDNERTGGGGVLTYKEPKAYKAAIAFLLAHSYGEPQVMSSYAFNVSDAGPPMETNGNIISPTINKDGTCGNSWVCQHRWRQIFAMVGFRNAAEDGEVDEWWDNDGNQISFCRGNNAFVAFNIESSDLNQTLQTCLPAGSYCDVISGEKVDGCCTGKTVTVDEDGEALITILPSDSDYVLAIHVGCESKLL